MSTEWELKTKCVSALSWLNYVSCLHLVTYQLTHTPIAIYSICSKIITKYIHFTSTVFKYKSEVLVVYWSIFILCVIYFRCTVVQSETSLHVSDSFSYIVVIL